jgi:16S rRNA (cytidine1402-2'-O)-methyltransferase
LEALRDIPGTLVFYESPKRLAAMLADAADVLGAVRIGAVCRELTKKFEEIRRGTLTELAENFSKKPPKGEIVVLVERGQAEKADGKDVQEALTDALAQMSMRDAVDAVSAALNLPRRKVYQMALARGKDPD